MIAVAEVYATDVEVLRDWVAPGTSVEAEISGPALGRTILHGKLTSAAAIGRSVARNAAMGFSPRADSDRRVVEVRVELDEASSKQAALFVGLEVDVKFIAPAARAGSKQP